MSKKNVKVTTIAKVCICYENLGIKFANLPTITISKRSEMSHHWQTNRGRAVHRLIRKTSARTNWRAVMENHWWCLVVQLQEQSIPKTSQMKNQRKFISLQWTTAVWEKPLTLAYFISMFSRGIRTFSNFRKPLSTSLKPNLGPISPTTMPERERKRSD